MVRNVIVVLLLLAASALVDGSRIQAVSSLHAKVKTKTHLRSHAKSRARRTRKVNESAADVDDDAADASDDDSDDSDGSDDDTDNTNHAEIDEAKDALHDIQWRKQTNKHDLDDFSDVKAFKTEVAHEAKIVSNETQSPGLANFLAEIRDEMHTYAAPTYSAHLEEKQKKLEDEEKHIEAKLAALENKTVAPTVKHDEKDTAAKKRLEVKVTVDDSKALEADEAEIKELKGKVEAGSMKAGHIFAFAFLGTVTMLSCVFAMASNKNDTVRNYTWFLLDQVVAIFLAVMYFQAFDDLLDFIDVAGQNKVLMAVVHSLIMLTLALVLAFFLRGQEVGLAILCGAGAHVVSFTSIHAAATVQNNVWLKIDFAWVWCLVGMVALGLALAAIGAAVFKAKQFSGANRDDGFMDKTDDMENDFGAMAFSVCWSMFIRFLITGHHPVDDDTDFDHTPADRHWMLGNAVVSLVIAVVALPYLMRPQTKYLMKRIMTFLSTVLAMNVAWSFFYWAEWELFETVFANQPIFGRIAFALLSTIIGAIGILALVKAPSRPGRGEGRMKKVGLTALGLMVAWSWELCFDAAIDDMCEGRDHPAMYKMGATVFMFAVVIPVYGIYMKPITMPAAEAIGA